MKSEFEIAITQLSADRNLAPEVILEAIENALVAAYKRNFGQSQNVSVSINPHSGRASVFVKKTVVETVEDDRNEISLAMAQTYDAAAEVGGFVDIEVKPRNFGRIAAQTAKQVITQRIREAERDSVYLEYQDRVGEIINATVRSIDGRSRSAVLTLGKAEALMPRGEQIHNESYRVGQRLRVYVTAVERSGHGPQIIVSRTDRGLLLRLMELEVPEIYAGTVEVKAIAREPGSRSKVAVFSSQPGVDPVGSCVGMRGVRVQSIVNELNGEKIDVVCWDAELESFIANSLSPAKVVAVYLNSEENTAKVVVPERSLSLAIGKEGQNARLAAKLTGWRIDIKSEDEAAAEAEQLALEAEEEAQRQVEMEEQRQAAAALLAAAEASLEEVEGEDAADQAGELETEEVLAEVSTDEAEEQPETSDASDIAAVEPVTEGEAVEAVETGEALDIAAEPATELDEATEVGVSDETPVSLDEPAADQAAEGETAEEWNGEAAEPAEDADWDDDEQDSKRSRSRRDRTLVYDERAGRVVARKRHKTRGRDWLDEWDEDEDWN